MRRRDRAALLAGIALALLHVVVALLLAHSGGAPARPIYDGPCPPTTCTPCPQLHCATFTPQPYTPPPTAPPSSSTPRSTTSSGSSTSRTSSSSSSSSRSQSSSSSSSTSASSSGTSPGAPASAGESPQGQSSPGAAAPQSHAVIGPEGGSIASPGGELTLRVPPGAVSQPVTLRVLSAAGIAPNPPAGRAAASQPWDVGGSGPGGPVLVFSKPVEISLRWTDVQPQFIEYWDGAAWDNLPTSVDAAAHTATASVPHLTVFQAFGTAAAAGDQGGGAGRVLAAIGLAVVAAGAVAAVLTRVLRRRPRARP